MDNRSSIRLTVDKDLALECQAALERKGVPLNVTQAVKAVLVIGLKASYGAEPLTTNPQQAATTAGDGHEQTSTH